MTQANLFAGLVGALMVEAQRSAWEAGRADGRVRELWYGAAGSAPPASPKTPVALPVLDAAAIDRVRAGLDAYGIGTESFRFVPGIPSHQSAPPRGFRELLSELEGKFSAMPDKPEETAENTLRALWLAAVGTPVSAEQSAEVPVPDLDAVAKLRLDELLRKRLSGVPLAHLTGRQRFMGLELLASREALVPRKETELLGHAALAVLRRLSGQSGAPRVIDVCTGAGNLAIALARHVPAARLYASDLSAEAVALARRNASLVGVDTRVEIRQGDFLEPFSDGSFDNNVDLLVCNPPYISSGKLGSMPAEIAGHEPSLAFDGGPFGVKLLQRLLTEAPRFLRPGGWLAFEVGLGQGPGFLDRVRRHPGYADAATAVDAAGAVRAIVARVS